MVIVRRTSRAKDITLKLEQMFLKFIPEFDFHLGEVINYSVLVASSVKSAKNSFHTRSLLHEEK